MTKRLAGVMLVLGLVTGISATVWTQGRALPVPGVEPARDVANAKEIPDAKTDYKVLFDVAKGADKPGEVNPMLQATARYLNTLAKVGVPPEHRKIAVIFHQGGTSAILKNGEYRARNNGQDNPNIAIIPLKERVVSRFYDPVTRLLRMFR